MTLMFHTYSRIIQTVILITLVLCAPLRASALADDAPTQAIIRVTAQNAHLVKLDLAQGQTMYLDFYGEQVFRWFYDPASSEMRNPVANPPAQILVDHARQNIAPIEITADADQACILTQELKVTVDILTGLLRVYKDDLMIIEQTKPIEFGKNRTTLCLASKPNEYFFGGGVQNGRFSHKGQKIAIVNENSWTDGGVASPTPYYWSTGDYGFLWHTFTKGSYDFGASYDNQVVLTHETPYLDVFLMIGQGCADLLNRYYQLTGNPVLLPKFAFYQGHLNAYNRDYWTPDDHGILFEDGQRYKESQKDNGGIKESLNGETNNYPFSARAVIDRYKAHDMPFGWLLPNDGYGAGYGQTSTLDSNILNLKSLTDYARQNGVEIGLWTQSDLHPKEGVSALLQRDMIKEVREAGVRVLKTDVAWVGAGYSFGLNGISDVAQIMTKEGDGARPFIITLDGWAGTQRYAGVWSGDQTGGQWEYIRFHIPTYIGSGLSGQPNICSDMDGIFGGKNMAVNMRDFQWKTFSPMQLNMDGWGTNEKYPHALGEPATSINRWYLKLKAMLMPYTYSIAREAVQGLPMIRAMFLEEAHAYTLGKRTQYQYLYGPYFLVAPIYQNTAMKEDLSDVRHQIYLPTGVWYDYFNGQRYEGPCVLNSFETPFWKLPVFVKEGAIIAMTKPHNQVRDIPNDYRLFEVYPSENASEFALYDDDGVSVDYLYKALNSPQAHITPLRQHLDANGIAEVAVLAQPMLADDQAIQQSEFWVNLSQAPRKVTLYIGDRKVKLKAIKSYQAYLESEEGFFFNPAPELNRFATPGSEFAQVSISKNPQLWIKTRPCDVSVNTIRVIVEGAKLLRSEETASVSAILSQQVVLIDTSASERGAYSLQPTWHKINGASSYEILFEDMRYVNIQDTCFSMDDLRPESDYTFLVRAVDETQTTAWTPLNLRTLDNPLEYALRELRAQVSVPEQAGFGVERFFDFAESGDMWHTKYRANAIPFDMTINLRGLTQVDKLHYLPRLDGGNGTILNGYVCFSTDQHQWFDTIAFNWNRDGQTKMIPVDSKPTARFIRLHVDSAVGNYGAGREFYVFKVPQTERLLDGDINKDGVIDVNDLMSYRNYTGLRLGDADFEGYISVGDVNQNLRIDAQDISYAATELEGGVKFGEEDTLRGKLRMFASSVQLKTGDILELRVRGEALKHVNAFGLAIPYSERDYEYLGIEVLGAATMENLSNDRLHSNGDKVLYPTFVNIGQAASLEGDQELMIIRFRVKRHGVTPLEMRDPILVDRQLHSL